MARMSDTAAVRAAVAAVLLLALAGCGGATGDENYVTRATAICKQTNERLRALGAPQSFIDTQLYARRAKDAVGDEIDELDELEPTPERAGSFDLYLATLEERRRLLGELAEAADGNSMQRMQTVGDELDALGQTAREQAEAAGIAPCEPV